MHRIVPAPAGAWVPELCDEQDICQTLAERQPNLTRSGARPEREPSIVVDVPIDPPEEPCSVVT
jgi:hypothetical protein